MWLVCMNIISGVTLLINFDFNVYVCLVSGCQRLKTKLSSKLQQILKNNYICEFLTRVPQNEVNNKKRKLWKIKFFFLSFFYNHNIHRVTYLLMPSVTKTTTSMTMYNYDCDYCHYNHCTTHYLCLLLFVFLLQIWNPFQLFFYLCLNKFSPTQYIFLFITRRWLFLLLIAPE